MNELENIQKPVLSIIPIHHVDQLNHTGLVMKATTIS
jgi:hypothetical protein